MNNARETSTQSALSRHFCSPLDNWKMVVYTHKTPSVNVADFTYGFSAAESTLWFWLFIWEINSFSQSLFTLPLNLVHVNSKAPLKSYMNICFIISKDRHLWCKCSMLHRSRIKISLCSEFTAQYEKKVILCLGEFFDS